MGDSQAKIRNDTAAVSPDQNILGLDVAMGNGGLALGPEYLRVEVDQARNGGDENAHGLELGERGPVEMVVEGAVRMVVGHQPQLGAGVTARAVRPNVTQDILVSKTKKLFICKEYRYRYSIFLFKCVFASSIFVKNIGTASYYLNVFLQSTVPVLVMVSFWDIIISNLYFLWLILIWLSGPDSEFSLHFGAHFREKNAV
jgi:hypothetical protein